MSEQSKSVCDKTVLLTVQLSVAEVTTSAVVSVAFPEASTSNV